MSNCVPQPTPANAAPSAQKASALLREQMPVTKELAYFDHAAVAPLTAVAAQAIADYARQACHHGDLHWPQWAADAEALRTVAARFIGADTDEVALVSNTTHGIGLVAEGFPWRSGDNVVVPDNEFPSNLLPWSVLSRHGVELRRVPVEPSGVLDLNRLKAAMDGRTRIVSASWVGFASGYRVDVDQVVELVHAGGALFMLDAIQGLGAFTIDVRKTQVDFLAADGHKWLLGPEGAGLFYLRREHLDLLRPLGVGWNSLAASGFDPHSAKLKTTAARYEGGSTNMPGMLALRKSLGLLQSLHESTGGQSPLSLAVLDNVNLLAERLRQADFQAYLPVDPQRQSGILGITWGDPGVPEQVALAARKYAIAAGVVLSVRAGRLRASTHAYNNAHDVERLVDALVSFRRSGLQ